MGNLLAPLWEPNTWYHVAGYGYAVLAPLFPLSRFSKVSYLIIVRDLGVTDLDIKKHHRADLPFWLGVIERILYVAAWLLGQPEFIGFWLALKVAGGWIGWSDRIEVPIRPGTKDTVTVSGRLIFNTHLIASALSALNALAGALITQRLIADDFPHAFWLGLLTAILTFWIWWRFQREYDRATINKHAA